MTINFQSVSCESVLETQSSEIEMLAHLKINMKLRSLAASSSSRSLVVVGHKERGAINRAL